MSVVYSFIREGEHLRQDFKFEISDMRKIARSLVAFANTEGGRLLVGVKDNGRIAGVRSDEEYHMIEAAASMYCQPPIPFTSRIHQLEGKTVLEIGIQPNPEKRPFKAKTDQGTWEAYFRVEDQNIHANPWLLKWWERLKDKSPVTIRYKSKEQQLLDLLNQYGQITIRDFVRAAHVPTREAEEILLDFAMLGIITFQQTEDDLYFFVKD
jgi:predicted HTH transcriptional regulator